MSPWLQHDLLVLTLEHITLVLISVTAAILVGVPLGIVIYRVPSVRRSALSVISIVQTIPSLALFGFLIPIPFLGVGKRTAVVALVLYALLPIVRNTFTGLLSVDEAVRESAVAMGMTPNQVLRIVEIPLALRTILTGIRVATVTTVGTATIAAAIGAGGLGVFIFRGVATVDTAQLLAGSIPAALIALVADAALGWVEKKSVVST